MRRLMILARWYWRRLRRYLTGRSAMATILVQREALLPVFQRRVQAYLEAKIERRASNTDLLTGMVVALLHGPNVLPWSGWELYRGAARVRSYEKGAPSRLVGRPVVYQNEHGVKLGATEFRADYVPRAEQLAARRKPIQLRRAA